MTPIPRVLLSKWTEPDFPLMAMRAGGHRYEPHCHDFHELVYVCRGGGVHVIDQRPYPMLRGDFYLMAPDDVHGYQAPGELGIVNLLFAPSLFDAATWAQVLELPGLRRYLERDGRPAPHKLALAPGHAAEMEGLCESLLTEFAQRGPGWQLAARAVFQRLLVLVSRASAAYGQQPSHEELPPGPIAEAVALIHRELERPLRVADLAAAVGLSPNWFGERFRDATGLAVLDYIAKLRLDRARILLEQDADSITGIALRVGFEDPSYFGRCFRRHTGLTPRAYRQRLAG
jgi:AraC family transcriptional regulator, L-rhamnose operon transcriptional activator RhaR